MSRFRTYVRYCKQTTVLNAYRNVITGTRFSGGNRTLNWSAVPLPVASVIHREKGDAIKTATARHVSLTGNGAKVRSPPVRISGLP